MGDRDVTIDLIGHDKASKAFGDVEASGGRLSKVLGGFGGVAKVAGGALLGAGTAALGLGKVAFDTGINVEAMGNKAKTVFGDWFPDAMEAADGLAFKLGMTQTEVVGLLGSFGDLLTPMGFTQDKALDMSTELANLSGALSLWSNGTKSSADVSDMLSDALTGEYDSLKSLGVQIDADLIKQRLHEQGKDKLTGAALKQAQAEVALAEITKQSSNALTAYDKGTNKLAIAKNKLSAQVKTFRDNFAQAMLPILVKGMTFLTETAVPALQRFSWWIGPKIKEAWDRVRPALQKFGSWIRDDLAPAIRNTVEKVMPMFRFALDNLKKAFGDGTTAGSNWGEKLRVAGAVVTKILQAVVVVAAAFAASFSIQMRVASAVIDKVVVPAIKLIWKVFSTQVGFILDAAAKAFGWVPGLGPKLKTAAAEFRKFRDAVNAALNGIQDETVFVNIRTTLSGQGKALKGSQVVRNVKAVGTGGFAAGGNPLAGRIATVGEHGPELVAFGENATVIPTGQSRRIAAGGGGNVYMTNNFNGSVIHERDLFRRLEAMGRSMRRSGAYVVPSGV